MPDVFQIPLKVGTPQRFSITLGQVDYQLTLKHRDINEGGWVLDIADTSGTPILEGVPLVTGADLLAQYSHLGFGGRLWVQTLSDPDAVPTFENLGDDGLLYWVTG
jgi:predicted Zn-dependent protease with MMP-like domain